MELTMTIFLLNVAIKRISNNADYTQMTPKISTHCLLSLLESGLIKKQPLVFIPGLRLFGSSHATTATRKATANSKGGCSFWLPPIRSSPRARLGLQKSVYENFPGEFENFQSFPRKKSSEEGGFSGGHTESQPDFAVTPSRITPKIPFPNQPILF